MTGELIKNKYLILQILGRNSCSETYLARKQKSFLPRRYIIKKFRPILGNSQVREAQRWFYQEASILKRLSGKNPQIPRLYEYFMDGEDFFLVREWIDGLTLEQKVQRQERLSATEVEQILKSILACLKYIHNSGIVYRQLTPSSIILRPTRSGDLPVLIYFGGVKELKTIIERPPQLLPLGVGHQPQYIAPEQEVGKSVYASDLYSLGLTAIYLLTGKTPAELPTDPQSQRLLWHHEVSDLNIHLTRAIDRAICPDMQVRFSSAEEMLNSLNSPPVNISIPLASVAQSTTKSRLTSELKIITALLGSGLSVLGVTFLWLNSDFISFSPSSWGRLVNYSEVERTTPESQSLSAVETTIDPQLPAFAPGVTPKQIAKYLGEPTNISQGNKPDSKTLLYQDLVPNQVNLSYLTDNQTQKIHRVEILFADSAELATIHQKVRQLLGNNYAADIEQNINQVYFNTSDRLEFALKDLSGEIRRNREQEIYFSVWEQ